MKFKRASKKKTRTCKFKRISKGKLNMIINNLKRKLQTKFKKEIRKGNVERKFKGNNKTENEKELQKGNLKER